MKFRKILVAEDFEGTNTGIVRILKETLTSSEVFTTKHCDNAFLKIKKALLDQQPYDLLITDISFEENYRERTLTSGIELIQAIRSVQPDLKIIVYSMESKPSKIHLLLNELNVKAYISKGRTDQEELMKAINKAYVNEQFISEKIKHILTKEHLFELNDYDATLLNKLSLGLKQKQISQEFITEQIEPSSISSIEKRINFLKEHFNANNTIHLITITKDMGLL